jgi:hypothetical protein
VDTFRVLLQFCLSKGFPQHAAVVSARKFLELDFRVLEAAVGPHTRVLEMVFNGETDEFRRLSATFAHAACLQEVDVWLANKYDTMEPMWSALTKAPNLKEVSVSFYTASELRTVPVLLGCPSIHRVSLTICDLTTVDLLGLQELTCVGHPTLREVRLRCTADVLVAHRSSLCDIRSGSRRRFVVVLADDFVDT